MFPKFEILPHNYIVHVMLSHHACTAASTQCMHVDRGPVGGRLGKLGKLGKSGISHGTC